MAERIHSYFPLHFLVRVVVVCPFHRTSKFPHSRQPSRKSRNSKSVSTLKKKVMSQNQPDSTSPLLQYRDPVPQSDATTEEHDEHEDRSFSRALPPHLSSRAGPAASQAPLSPALDPLSRFRPVSHSRSASGPALLPPDGSNPARRPLDRPSQPTWPLGYSSKPFSFRRTDVKEVSPPHDAMSRLFKSTRLIAGGDSMRSRVNAFPKMPSQEVTRLQRCGMVSRPR